MSEHWKAEVRATYDEVADEYVRRIYDELKDKPLDRQFLDRFASSIPTGGIVCDMGCGPGQIARYLSERKVKTVGVDLSPQLIERARGLNPGIEFWIEDMTALSVPDGAWDGIVAFYSIVNIPPDKLEDTFREFRRTLRPDGRLILSFHIGDQKLHLDEWWDKKVSVDFYFFEPAKVASLLRSAGFTIDEVIEREPHPEIEHPSKRAYLFCSRGSE